MIKQEHINGKVQKAFQDKVKSLKKLDKNTNKNFFDNVLDVNNTNPIDQEFYRMSFAKISVAVPNVKESLDQNKIVRQPISISSYMNNSEENKVLQAGKSDTTFNTKITDPIAFNQGSEEKNGNRFRGHSGIKSIKAAQQEYFTYQYTIEWECPDPVYFEKVFEPAFLKLGAAMSIEFGYGRNFDSTTIPPITIEDMERYLKDQKLNEKNDTIRKRNLRAPGTYYCDIGIIDKFDYKLTEGGGYTGNLQVISMGTSPLLETQPVGDESDNSNELRRSIDNLSNFDKLGKELFGSTNLSEEQQTEVFKNIIQSSTDIKTLLTSGITFGAVMKNLDKVLDKYFDTNQVGFGVYQIKNYYVGDDKEKPAIKYRFKDGAMYFDFESATTKEKVIKFFEETDFEFMRKSGFYNWLRNQTGVLNDGYEPNKKLRKRYHMSYGFFEDIILGSFFELKANVTEESDGNYIQRIRSVETKEGFEIERFEQRSKTDIPIEVFSKEERIFTESNKCIQSPFVYSLGLDSVMLPKQTHPLLIRPFDDFTEKEIKQARSIYDPKQLRSLEVIRSIFKLFDEAFRDFNALHNGEPLKGSIRDMVFPIELYETHFQNATSLRQALTNFWSDVSSFYGGYWRFVVGQSSDDNLTIGVSDMRVSPPNPDELTQQEDLENKRDEELEKLKKCYVFELYSENSIIRSFDLSLDLSSETSVLARYGKYKPRNTKGKITSLSDVSIEAWNLLTETPNMKALEEEEMTLEDYQKFIDLQPEVIKNLSYPSDNGKSRAYVDTNPGNNIGVGNYFINEIRERNENGFVYSDIPEINEDTAQELEKINNEYSSLYKGIGIYNKDGNMSAYFKQTMLYLLNTAKIKGSGSLITTHPILIPLTITMSLDGVGGLKVGDIFKVDYLPKPYRKHTYFVISKVDHSVSSTGWTTDIEAYMQMIPESYFKEHKKRTLTAQESDLLELFKFTTPDVQDIITNLSNTEDSKVNQFIAQYDELFTESNNVMEFINSKGLNGSVETLQIRLQIKRDARHILKANYESEYEVPALASLTKLRGQLDKQFIKIKQTIINIEKFEDTLNDLERNNDKQITKIVRFLEDNYADEKITKALEKRKDEAKKNLNYSIK